MLVMLGGASRYYIVGLFGAVALVVWCDSGGDFWFWVVMV